jgi:hypothetical protein
METGAAKMIQEPQVDEEVQNVPCAATPNDAPPEEARLSPRFREMLARYDASLRAIYIESVRNKKMLGL